MKHALIRFCRPGWLLGGLQARLYLHDLAQPTLIVNDLKTGAEGKGAIALWLDIGTVAHFRNLTVTPSR